MVRKELARRIQIGKGDRYRDVTEFLICGDADAGKSPVFGRTLSEADEIASDGHLTFLGNLNGPRTVEGGLDFSGVPEAEKAERVQVILVDITWWSVSDQLDVTLSVQSRQLGGGGFNSFIGRNSYGDDGGVRPVDSRGSA